MEAHNRHLTPAELLHHDSYTPQELAEVLDVSVHLIEREAFAGHLKADIVDHHVVRVSRRAAIAWLEWRAAER
ncbi:MAG TPA: hypothetical protein VFQ80_05650 [Thermomicrobiales bacterium]|nr:hypothetical protein [Thermomicrobiales bacterium]